MSLLPAQSLLCGLMLHGFLIASHPSAQQQIVSNHSKSHTRSSPPPLGGTWIWCCSAMSDLLVGQTNEPEKFMKFYSHAEATLGCTLIQCKQLLKCVCLCVWVSVDLFLTMDSFCKDELRSFRDNGIFSYSTMLIREDLGVLLLGARGAIFALDLNNISAEKSVVRMFWCWLKNQDAVFYVQFILSFDFKHLWYCMLISNRISKKNMHEWKTCLSLTA